MQSGRKTIFVFVCRRLGCRCGLTTPPWVRLSSTTYWVCTVRRLHADAPGLHQFTSRLQHVKQVRAYYIEIIFMILSWAWHSLMVVCTINGNGSWDWGLFFVLFITIYFLLPSANILESFETHQPLVLPDGGYQFQLGREVLDSSLVAELDNIKKFVSGSQLKQAAATEKQKVWNSVNTLVCYSWTCLLGIQLLQNGHLCQSL